MEFLVKHVKPAAQRSACLIIGVYEKRRLHAEAQELDKASDGYLSAVLKRGDMDGRNGQTLMLQQVNGITADRVLLVGLGRESDLNDRAYGKALLAAYQALSNCGARDALCLLGRAKVSGRSEDWLIRAAAQGFVHASYRFDACKSQKDDRAPALRKLTFAVADKRNVAAAQEAARHGQAIGEGMNLARELGNLPGNICTPSYLATQAHALQERFPAIDVDVLDEDTMEELGMGALLSVSRGSEQEARLIVMHYRGASDDERPHVLVGKGITFDTGGISIKPGAAMDEMKFDMCGAASAFGTMQAAASLKLPLNLVVIVAAAENMPDGRATKPGDIVTSMSGQTIEILNTDAEGRLVLCDALTYAERYRPASVVNMATLTGACIIALGHHKHGLMSNNNRLAGALLKAGETAQDAAWQLPLGEEYDEQLKSNFADLQNIGGRSAGTITAGCFLARFTKQYRWAHLDIAGTAWKSGDQKGATGRPVPLLTQYLLDSVGRGS